MGRLGLAAPLAIAALVLPPLGSIVLFWKIDTIGQWLRGHAEVGPAIYVLCFWALCGLALLPTYATAVVGGWAFGFAAGFPAALVGFVGAALVGYVIARGASGDRVVRIIEANERWQVVYNALLRSGRARALLIVTLLRMPPNSPFAATNLVLAATRTPLGVYLLGTAAGMAPRTAAAVWAAQQISDLKNDPSRPWWFVAVGVALTIVVLVVIGTIARHALQRVARPRA